MAYVIAAVVGLALLVLFPIPVVLALSAGGCGPGAVMIAFSRSSVWQRPSWREINEPSP
jgi:hypothetical protein